MTPHTHPPGTTIQFLDDGPDQHGRRTYATNWHDGYRCRGQVFFAVPPPDAVVVSERQGCESCFYGRPCERVADELQRERREEG